MRILAIAPQPFFSPRGTPFSVYYRTMVMGEQGSNIDLLTYGQGSDVLLPNTRIIRIPNFKFLGNVKTGPSLLKLFLDIFMLVWTIGLLLRYRYDAVHAHEEAVFFCRFLKPLFRFKLIYDMHSSLPQQLDNFQFTDSKLIKNIFTRLEDSSIDASDAIITICPDLSDYVEQRIGPDDPRHFLIENSIFDPVRLANGATATDKNLPPLPENVPLVIYAGTFEAYQGIDLLLQAFKTVHETRSDVRLLMVGGTDEQVAQYSDLARQLGLEAAVIFTGRVSPDVARELNRRADVLTSPRSAGTNTPLKIYEQLASGKPLVATRIHSHTQVLDDAVAFLVEPSAEGLAEGILQAVNDPSESVRRSEAAKALYETAYSRSAYTDKMSRLLEHLT